MIILAPEPKEKRIARLKELNDLIESGKEVVQETLRFDDASGETSSMRSKEDAHDYRYFREPDLPRIYISDEEIDEIRKSLPKMPDERMSEYLEYGIPEKDAGIIVKYKKASDFFERSVKGIENKKAVSNFIIGQIFRRLENEQAKEDFNIKITPEQLNEMVRLIEKGKLKNNLAKSAFEKMLDTGKSVTDFVSEEDMTGPDENAVYELCKKAVISNEKAVNDYKNGKQAAIKAILGFVMKESRGKADARQAEEMIIRIINGN